MLPHRIVLAVFTALVSQGNIAQALPGGRYFESEHLGGQAKRDFLDTNTNLEKRTPAGGPVGGKVGAGGGEGDGTVCPGTVVVYKDEPTGPWDIVNNILAVYAFADIAWKGGKWVLTKTNIGKKCKAFTEAQWKAAWAKKTGTTATVTELHTAVRMAREQMGIEMVNIGDPECGSVPAVGLTRVNRRTRQGLSGPELSNMLSRAATPVGSPSTSVAGGSDRGESPPAQVGGGTVPAPVGGGPSREASPGSESSGGSFKSAVSQPQITALMEAINSGASVYYAVNTPLPDSPSGSESGRK